MDKNLIRTSESPARTIDSRDSTTESIETIVDRNNQQQQHQLLSQLESQTTTMANSTNTTNNCNKNSLTNSQISMISSNNDQKDNHIYTSPDLIFSKITKSTIEEITNPPDKLLDTKNNIKSSLGNGGTTTGISEEIIKSKTMMPSSSTVVIPKSFDVEKFNLNKSLSIIKKKPFPIRILLGLIQLILSIALTALGGLLIARGASLASSASGLWSGGICAIAGALGVINLRKAQTGFLAVSLICVASSTLAMALTGIGLVRDVNRLEITEFNNHNTKAAISAGGGLVFTLVLHFIVSITSVYQSALRLCSRYNKNSSSQIIDNVVTGHNTTIMSQQKVEEYIKSMNGDKVLSPEECEKLKSMWLYAIKRGNISPPIKTNNGIQQSTLHRPPVMLVPAAAGNGFPPMLLPPGFRSATGTLSSIPPPPPSSLGPGPILYPSPVGIYPPGCVVISHGNNGFLPYHHHHPHHPSLSSLPPLPLGSIYHPNDSMYNNKMMMMHSLRIGTNSSELGKRHLKRRNGGKNDPNRRQRRKSDSDMENRKAFTYTGLDRAIADSFLERQELSQGCSINGGEGGGCNGNGGGGGGGGVIVSCNDVDMNAGNNSHLDYSSSGISRCQDKNNYPDVAI